MKNIYVVIDEYLDRGESGVLATIVKRTGATPQGAGAKMFIGADGRMFGTVGGGCLEAEIWQNSRKILKTKEADVFRYVLDGKNVEDDGMICGGNIDVLLEPVDEKYRDLYRQISGFKAQGKKAVTITSYGARGFTKTLCTSEDELIGDLTGHEKDIAAPVFHEKKPTVLDNRVVEPIVSSSTLYLYGAGHVSQFICRLAKTMDFAVTVFDDRVEFANRERFPEADNVIVDDFGNALKYADDEDNIYAAVVTRGHKHDALVLEQILTRPHRYIGMIGSKRKIRIIFDYLETKGFGESLLQSIYAPIGVDINAETPQEIALSIVAEIVKVRGGK
ncbi:MAG TPA: XdhC family protein [Syntrophorhabdaceae bacterium]|nr:XdhC family protein [Syntrophorhabdaceae bacterium]